MMEHSLDLTDWYISNYAMLNLACSCNYEDISKSLLAWSFLVSVHFCICIFNCPSLVWMVVKDFNLVSEVELVLGWLRLRLWIYGKLKQRYIKSTEKSSPAFTNFFLSDIFGWGENTKQFHQLCKRAIRFIMCIMQANTSPGVSCFGANVEKRRDWGRWVTIKYSKVKFTQYIVPYLKITQLMI